MKRPWKTNAKAAVNSLTSNCEVQTQEKTLTICCNICLVIGSLENRYAHHTVQHSNVKVFDKYVEMYLPTSKTDQFRKGYTIQICKHEDSTVCPVSTLGSYLGFRSNFQGPLFCHFDGKSLSSYRCAYLLSTVSSPILKRPWKINAKAAVNSLTSNCEV
jgi:hypothetical protein